MRAELVTRIVRSYPIPIRLYGFSRFRIISPRLLEAIEQHLPEEGEVLDLGCGFGMFTLYLAIRRQRCSFTGLDINESRIHQATRIADMLQFKNVKFINADVQTFVPDRSFDTAYCIDLLHHLNPQTCNAVLDSLSEWLKPDAVIQIKEINTRPRAKLFFTFILDLLVSPNDSFWYRDEDTYRSLLAEKGFTSLESYPIGSMLPYPHFLLLGRKG